MPRVTVGGTERFALWPSGFPALHVSGPLCGTPIFRMSPSAPLVFKFSFHRFGKTPWRRAWVPTPVFLPGEFRGQRSVVGYSPKGLKELVTTERLSVRIIIIILYIEIFVDSPGL